MSKLLSANFVRLRKSRIFWLCMIFVFCFGAYMYLWAWSYMKKSSYVETIDHYFFNNVPLAGILMAVVCSLFIGTEYSDGAIRNKLIVGHTRTAVYLSNLIVCFAAGVFLCISYIAAAFLTGIPLLGFFQKNPVMIFYCTLCNVLMTFAFTGIMVLLSMINHNKAANAVISIILALVLLFTASRLDSRLSEPEMIDQYIMVDEVGKPMEVEQEANPLYLKGVQREIYQWAEDILPSGQAIQMANFAGVYPERWPLCSLTVILVTTGLGIFLFQKKDIK